MSFLAVWGGHGYYDQSRDVVTSVQSKDRRKRPAFGYNYFCIFL